MDNFITKFQSQDLIINQESFSFSSFDFNSSLGIFSDDDQSDDHENEESYIEITLEQQQEQTVVPPNADKDDNLEFLRVSFSSSVCSFPGFSSSATNSSSRSSSIATSTFPSSSVNQTETGGPAVLCIKQKRNGGRTGFTTLNRLVDALLSTLKLKTSSSLSSSPSSSAAALIGNSNGCAISGGRQHEKQGSWEVVRNRKAALIVNGGARELLIKFRSINILSMVASFVKPKPRKVIASSTINTNFRTTTTKSHDEAFALRNHSVSSSSSQRNINKHLEGTNSPKLRRRNGNNSRLLEINLESITKMVEAASKNIGGTRGKSKQSKSCPGSMKASPIHNVAAIASRDNKKIIYGRENSIQAAIAYCKQSFGQNIS